MLQIRRALSGLSAALLLAASLALNTSLASAAEATAPQSVVERLDEILLSTMKEAKDLGFQGRLERLTPILEESFDYTYMARVSVGSHWSKLDDAQRETLVSAFAKLSAATFANRFSGYGGESFKVVGQEDKQRGAVLVLNDLVKSDGEVVPINYLLRERKGSWRIIDIFLDAKISELAVKRSEYGSVIGREGFDTLIEVMQQKTAQLAN